VADGPTSRARDTIEEAYRQALPFMRLEFDGVTHSPVDATGALRDFWARITIIFGDATESTMGDENVGENQIFGVAILDMFGAPGAVRGQLLVKADDARRVLSRKTIDGVEFGPTSGPGEPVTDTRDAWLQVSLSTRFTIHEVH